jgi:hypothetical protein
LKPDKRGVAPPLAGYYVRDVGAAGSSPVTPTNKKAFTLKRKGFYILVTHLNSNLLPKLARVIQPSYQPTYYKDFKQRLGASFFKNYLMEIEE